MSSICIIKYKQNCKNSESILKKIIKQKAESFGIGVFFPKNEQPLIPIEGKECLISLADSNQFDNCERLLLPDDCYYNGYGNSVSFVQRMEMISNIIYVVLHKSDRVELFVGDLGEYTISEFEYEKISFEEFTSYMCSHFNRIDICAKHLEIT